MFILIDHIIHQKDYESIVATMIWDQFDLANGTRQHHEVDFKNKEPFKEVLINQVEKLLGIKYEELEV